jgi:uncharacterized protein (TIGR00297 family)
MQLLSGFLLGVAIAWLAWRLGSLSTSGAVAAAIMGTAIFGLGGRAWAVPLLTFFISSSALSRTFKRRKALFDEKFAKGSQRDAGQVLANGGLGTLLVIAANLWPHPAWFIAYLGSLASVNADTWATEIGVLSRAAPRLITTGKQVAAGTSGGISALGTLATLLGGAVIELSGMWVGEIGAMPITLGMISVAGLTGSLFDSLLGATVQAIYTCPACDKETERHPLHTCGAATMRLRGWRWLNNDRVNFLASLMGASSATVLWMLFQQI